MSEQKALKVIVFEDDKPTAQIVKKLLNTFGHDVTLHTSPLSCPVFSSSTNACPNTSPCADVVISDVSMPGMNGIDFLRLQKDHGCKIHDDYKALMSAALSPEQENNIRTLGYKFFKKPFKSLDIIEWLEGCAKRKVVFTHQTL